MGQMGHIGLYINRCGGEPKEIYKNYFSHLEYAGIAYGNNRNDEGEGLVLRCNEFDQNKNDIVVIGEDYPEGDGGVPVSNMGIAYYQGTPDYPAGNWFTEQAYQFLDLNYNNSTDNNLRYYYHLNATQPEYYRLYPAKVNSGIKVYRSSGYYIWSDTCCTSKPLDLGEREELISESVSLTQEIDSLSSELTLLVDGGNTAALNATVISSIPQQALQLYDELMLKSPDLSDSVLNSSILKEDVLNNAFLRDILSANPQAAKRDSLMGKLDQRLVPMPDTMKAEILVGIHYLSAKENLEAVIQFKRMQERDLFNRLVYSYCHDSLVTSPSDSLMSLFTSDALLVSKYQLAFLNLKSGNTAGVNSVLSGIPGSFTLSAADQVVHQQYLTLFNTLIQIDSGNLCPWKIDNSQALTLDQLAGNDTILPGTFARNILQAAGFLEYSEVVVLPEDSLKSVVVQDENNGKNLVNAEKKSWVKVYPNPAGSFFVIEYQAQRNDTPIHDIHIELYLNQGVKIEDISVEKIYHQIIRRCDLYSSGLYLAVLKVNGKKEASIKFIITH